MVGKPEPLSVYSKSACAGGGDVWWIKAQQLLERAPATTSTTNRLSVSLVTEAESLANDVAEAWKTDEAAAVRTAADWTRKFAQD